MIDHTPEKKIIEAIMNLRPSQITRAHKAEIRRLPEPIQTRGMALLMAVLGLQLEVEKTIKAQRDNGGIVTPPNIKRKLSAVERHCMAAIKQHYKDQEEIADMKREITRLTATDAE
jgi:hypothetical protein